MYCNKAIATTDAVENIFSNGYEMEEEYMYEEDVPLYEDIDAFSDVGYDSDECEVNLDRKRYYDEDEDSEDEIWEDEEADEEISNAIRLKLLREKSKKELQGLSVLEGKLNWLEKLPVVESDLDSDDYPVLGAIVKPAPKKQELRVRTPNTSPGKYMPAMNIKVRVGNRTYIEFEHIICKAINEGKSCPYGAKCRYSHDVPKPKVDYSTRLCNHIRNGEECKFEGRCKFSHDINLLRKPSGKSTDQKTGAKSVKPMCKNDLKCENRKCTFTHPPGHKKPPAVPKTDKRVPNKSPNKSPIRTPNSSPGARPLDKSSLCKNMQG